MPPPRSTLGLRRARSRVVSSLALLLLPLLGGCDGSGDACSDPGPPCATCTRTEDSAGCASYVCPAGCLQLPRNDTASPDGGSDGADAFTGTPARFVRIDDLSNDDGADIDSVLVARRDGSLFYADIVVAYETDRASAFDDPNEALGPPDSVDGWTGPEVVCDLEAGYVSLSGRGSTLIVGVATEIEPGDYLVVLEVGGCTGNRGPEGIPDSIDVSVSAQSELDGQWILVASGEGPVIAAIVPQLPED